MPHSWRKRSHDVTIHTTFPKALIVEAVPDILSRITSIHTANGVLKRAGLPKHF